MSATKTINPTKADRKALHSLSRGYTLGHAKRERLAALGWIDRASHSGWKPTQAGLDVLEQMMGEVRSG